MMKSIVPPIRLTPHLAIYAGLFVIFMATGIWGGRLLGSSSNLFSPPALVSDSPIAVRTPMNTLATDQQNLLVIGVDQLKVGNPELISIWLVMFFPGKPDFTFLPVYPVPGEKGAGASSDLQASFSLDRAGRPDLAFLHQLSDWIWWNNYVVIDQTGMISLIDMVGGIPLHKGHLDGAQVMAKLASSSNESNTAFAKQVSLLEGICTQIHKTPSKKELATILRKIKPNLVTNLDLKDSLDIWFDQNEKFLTVHCEFPINTSSIP